ncbi:T9SS type A sorting domain-containing protein [Cytophagaceae bacterium ABcell3]|nr:T9SS type A sorting domain-containing protein [Cytophagaceae bacterium ABcell3]
MICRCILLLFLVCFINNSLAQELRFFEFHHPVCAENDWRDSSFIAATSDPEVIEEVMEDLGKPVDQRRFIIGNIEEGHGGYNFNGPHAFLWHFVPGEWSLTEVAIELCDGCPYTMVDQEIDYWLHTVEQFCPWSSYVRKEIETPVAVSKAEEERIKVFPNPAHNEINIVSEGEDINEVSIMDMNGKTLINRFYHTSEITMDLSALPEGLYILQMKFNGKHLRKLINVVH